jgi:hypothetical protein
MKTTTEKYCSTSHLSHHSQQSDSNNVVPSKASTVEVGSVGDKFAIL